MTDDVAGPVVSGPLDRGPLRFLPMSIRQPRSAWRSIAVGWIFTIVPSLALSALATALVPSLGRPEFHAAGPLLLFLLVVFAPVVETFIMVGFLELFLRFVPPPVAVIMSAAGWGIAHSLAAPAWGLVIWWGFLIFSTLYVAWRGEGRLRAIAIVASVHALLNLGPALLLMNGSA